MPLVLTVLRCPDSVAPETRTISGGEFTVGRGPGVDWILPDPERLLSKRHFAIAYRSGAWQIADTSTNGTTLNRDAAPIGHEAVRTLRDGDRLTLGAYEIEVRLQEDAVAQPPFGAGFGHPAGTRAANPFADPFGLDPLAPPAPARPAFGETPGHFGLSPGAVQLPADFDPLAPDPNPTPFLGPTQEDHRPVMEDAFQPQRIGLDPMPLGNGKLPADALLPDDWDKDLLSGIRPPSSLAPPAPPPASPVVPPVQRAAPAAPPLAASGDIDPFAEPEPPASLRPADPPAAARTPTPFDEPFELEPPSAPSPAQPVAAPAPPRAAPAPQPASVADISLLAAFLQGADMTDVQPVDAAATMRRLGAAFRALVAGLRAVLIARASIKSEFRIEQTMIRARGNNPLKFAADDDDALAALLGAGRRTDMSASEAVTDSLKDIKLHELASMAAMQSAVRTLLEGIDPAKLRAQAEQGGGLSLLPAQRKARAWDTYEAVYARTVQALADDFDSVFGKAFARAYERALDDIAAEEK